MRVFLVLATSVVAAPLIQAGPVVLFDNLTPGGYQPYGYGIFPAWSAAQKFHVAETVRITQVQIALAEVDLLQGSEAPRYDVSIVGSIPDASVDGGERPDTGPYLSWNGVPGAGLNVLDVSAPIFLPGGSNYWVLVESFSGNGQWLYNANGSISWMAQGAGEFMFPDESVGGGLRIYGETGAPVPEPATLALVGAGLAAAMRRRKRD